MWSRVYQPLAGVVGNAEQQFLQKREFDDCQVGTADDEVRQHVSDS